jgi:hypothetical protein
MRIGLSIAAVLGVSAVVALTAAGGEPPRARTVTCQEIIDQTRFP